MAYLLKLKNGNQIKDKEINLIDPQFLKNLIIKLNEITKEYKKNLKIKFPFFAELYEVPMDNIKTKIILLKDFFNYFNITIPNLKDYPGDFMGILDIYSKNVEFELAENIVIEKNSFWIYTYDCFIFERCFFKVA